MNETRPTLDVDGANQEAFERLTKSEPVLVDVRPAIEVVPGMTSELVLTSGPPLDFSEYHGGQRAALIGGALYEGLASSPGEASEKFSRGEIRIGSCHDHGCVGSVAGIYTASMPVFCVRNQRYGNTGFCNLYEGKARARLNYGVYNEEVGSRLRFLAVSIGPVLGAAVRQAGGIPLKPIMARALHMGDELHSRNTAASLLFSDRLFPDLLDLVDQGEIPRQTVKDVLRALTEDNYFFLRLSMASAKATADAARNIEASSVVTAMTLNCRGFAIRVSGLGDRWFSGSHPQVAARLFEGHTEDEITWIGGESVIAETVGLGGFAQAAAFALAAYQGGSPEVMIENNRAMYEITVGEHPDFQIPFFGYRGTPTGIDIRKVIRTGALPVIDAGIAGRDGGQIGAGVIRAPRDCFESAYPLEYEFYIYQADDELLRENRYRELETFGRGWDCYSISRFPSFEPLAREFLSRMEAVGVHVEAFHTELGHGMFEFAIEHESPLKAADDAVRAKLYLKQLCAEEGLLATFMPAIHIGTGDSCCGAHHHLSLWRDGKNISWDGEARTLSPVTRWFAAGMMETMPDFHLVFRPWVNSFRRLNSLLWNPENASWGLDSHTAAIRVIHGSVPEKHTRLEHRTPGSDVNPYLCLAVMLLGGLQGIRDHLEPGGYAIGDPLKYERFKMLTRSYPESIEAFRSSENARQMLGDAFVDHYASVKSDEWSDFTKWAAESGVALPTEQVTDWEFRRYFVWV